jgi:hypothetical protein
MYSQINKMHCSFIQFYLLLLATNESLNLLFGSVLYKCHTLKKYTNTHNFNEDSRKRENTNPDTSYTKL